MTKTKWVARGVLGLCGFGLYLVLSLMIYYVGGSLWPAFLVVPACLATVFVLCWALGNA